MLDKLTREDWNDYLGQAFQVELPAGAALTMQLAEVKALGGKWSGAKREPYALLFHGPHQPVLHQGIIELKHARMGDLALFLVPVGPDAKGMGYEAIFT